MHIHTKTTFKKNVIVNESLNNLYRIRAFNTDFLIRKRHSNSIYNISGNCIATIQSKKNMKGCVYKFIITSDANLTINFNNTITLYGNEILNGSTVTITNTPCIYIQGALGTGDTLILTCLDVTVWHYSLVSTANSTVMTNSNSNSNPIPPLDSQV